MDEIKPEFNNIPNTPMSSDKKKPAMVVIFVLILIVVAVGAYYFLQSPEPNIAVVPVTQPKPKPEPQVFTMLDVKKTPPGFQTDFPKNGLVNVVGSEQFDVSATQVEGVLRFFSSKTTQENYDYYIKYFTEQGWTASKINSTTPGVLSGVATKGTDKANFNLADFTDATKKTTKSVVEIIIFTSK